MYGNRKPKFRTRKLEPNRTILVYTHDHPSIQEDLLEADGRSAPTVATGVEKEEEEELHLKQALTSQKPYYIPTGETARASDVYEKIYSHFFRDEHEMKEKNDQEAIPWKMHKDLIKFTEIEHQLECMQRRMPAYCLDEKDAKWIRTHKRQLPTDWRPEHFEHVFDVLEDMPVVPEGREEALEKVKSKLGNAPDPLKKMMPFAQMSHQFFTESKRVINIPSDLQDSTLMALVDWWRERRQGKSRKGQNFAGSSISNLLPTLKFEDDPGTKAGTDPYVCFRRRQLKAQRKTRRSEHQTQARIQSLYSDLSYMQQMLTGAIQRDQSLAEAIRVETELFDRYRRVDAWRRANGCEWPPSLPSFKTATQSLLEASGGGERGGKPSSPSSSKSAKKRRKRGGIGGSSGGASQGRVESILASLRARGTDPRDFSKFYYPPHVAKVISEETRTILGRGLAETTFLAPEKPPVSKPFYIDPFDNRLILLLGRHYQEERHHSSHPPTHHHAKARTTPLHQQSTPLQKYTSSIIKVQDFTQLQTPIGNYNIHAMQVANQITRPLSFQAWQAAAHKLAEFSVTAGSTKKKRKRESQTSATGTTTRTNSREASNINNNNNGATSSSNAGAGGVKITVNIRENESALGSSEGGGGGGNVDPNKNSNASTVIHTTPNSGSRSFTPHGLVSPTQSSHNLDR